MEEDKVQTADSTVDEEVKEAQKQVAQDMGINLAEDDNPNLDDSNEEEAIVPADGEQADKTEKTPEAKTVSQETPAKIAGKFNSQDELVKSYQELEKKLGNHKETEQYAQIGKEFATRLQTDPALRQWYDQTFGSAQPQTQSNQTPTKAAPVKDLEAIKPLIDEAVAPYKQTLEQIQAERVQKEKELQIQEINKFDESYGKELSDDETNQLMSDAILIRQSPKFASEPLSKSLERAYFERYPEKQEQAIKLKTYAEMKEGQMASIPSGANGSGSTKSDSGVNLDKDVQAFYEGLRLNPSDLASYIKP